MPRTERRIGRTFRELTGFSEACLGEAIPEADAWSELRQAAALVAGTGDAAAPSVIHFARFELPFLRDLHARLDAGVAFPLDVACVHSVAARLFPDLPRRNIRALAGHLGHAPELVRRAAGHVEATAFIWRALIPLLEATGVRTWEELGAWLSESAPMTRRTKRSFPLAAERRRALPDAPGVYRFVRRSGDVVYVGKAASLRKRVSSHFKSRGPMTERGLELLTQVHEIQHVETATVLEAALFECDEIKRLNPPYNVLLRERRAWFASRDSTEAQPAPDASHPVGPLPSERALAPLGALKRLVEGAEPSARLRADALAVPVAFAPKETLFDEGFRSFVRETLGNGDSPAAERLARASLTVWVRRGRAELEPSGEERAPNEWDLARVLRRLERNLVQTGLLVRRARWLCLLADATVAFRERGGARARALVVAGGEIVERRALESVNELGAVPATRPRPLVDRQRSFDGAAYDRLRTLLTELRRVHDEGGELAIRVGAHRLEGARLAAWLRTV